MHLRHPRQLQLDRRARERAHVGGRRPDAGAEILCCPQASSGDARPQPTIDADVRVSARDRERLAEECLCRRTRLGAIREDWSDVVSAGPFVAAAPGAVAGAGVGIRRIWNDDRTDGAGVGGDLVRGNASLVARRLHHRPGEPSLRAGIPARCAAVALHILIGGFLLSTPGLGGGGLDLAEATVWNTRRADSVLCRECHPATSLY